MSKQKSKKNIYVGYRAFFKVISRASFLANTPEKNLLVAVIAAAMTEETNPHYVPREAWPVGWNGGFKHGWFTEELRHYCDLLHIDPVYVEEQAKSALIAKEAYAG